MEFQVLQCIGLFQDEILSYLDWKQLLEVSLVCRGWWESVHVERVWRAAARKLFEGKYVRTLCLDLIAPGNCGAHREDLMGKSVSALKAIARTWGVDVRRCVEKKEMCQLIHARQTRKMGPRECLALFAIRIAWLDRKRNFITQEELCAQEWGIRVRQDGPMGRFLHRDPWWQGRRSGRVTFFPGGRLSLVFPEDLNPFLGMDVDELGYTIRGNIVQLSVGVNEFVLRHPVHWRFMLHSGGTVWTSFEMPARGEDPTIEDGNINHLAVAPNEGFIL